MEQEHMEDDSVKLLRECNAGIKMGTSSIEDVLEHVQSGGLSGILKDSHDIHCKLGNKTHEILEKYHDEGKEPAALNSKPWVMIRMPLWRILLQMGAIWESNPFTAT